MKVLIIEDEINAAAYLETIIKKVRPAAEILAQLESVEDAVNWLHQHEHPDLLFLDIQLADGLSFEIFKHVDVKSPVIFTTAYDQYAIEAFKVNSIDYLLKPIHVDDLQRALEKFDQRQPTAQADLSAELAAVFGQLNQQKKHRCLIKKGNHFEFINIADVALVNSEDSLTFLYTFQGKKHLYNNTVEGFMEILDQQQFFQINRAQIINIDAIEKIHPYFNQRMKIEPTSVIKEIELLVSRSKNQPFKDWIDG
jgi:DNA-binding LytR/AlgR family response regulator